MRPLEELEAQREKMERSLRWVVFGLGFVTGEIVTGLLALVLVWWLQ